MKIPRPLLVAMGVVALVGVVLATLAFLPGVQRWALLRAAAQPPSWPLEVAEVSIGWQKVSIRGVALQHAGLSIKFDELTADYSLRQLLWSRRLEVHQLTVAGLLVDGRQPAARWASVAAVTAPLTAAGLLAQWRLPLEFTLDDILLEGRILLPGAAAVVADFKLSGGQFAPGRAGALQLKAVLKNAAPNAPVSVLHAQINLQATQGLEHYFTQISVTALVDAFGKNITEQSQLKLSVDLEQSPAGEKYSLHADTLVGGMPENILTLSASLPLGAQEYAGQWSLKAQTAQVEPFSFGGLLPDFKVNGDGRFGFNPGRAALSLQGELQGEVNRLEGLNASWRDLGAVSLVTKFDITGAGSVIRLNQLDVRLNGAQPILELQAKRAAQLNLKEQRLQVGPADAGDTLDLNIIGLPIAWLSPLVPQVKLTGGLITGRLTAVVEQQRLHMRVVEPLRFAALSITHRGQPWLEQAEVSLQAEAKLTAQELAVQISELKVQTAAGDHLKAQATVTLPVTPAPSITVKAHYTGDWPQLLAPWLPVGRLRSTGQLEATKIGEKLSIRQLDLALTRETGALLGRAIVLQPFTVDLAAGRAWVDQPPPKVASNQGQGDLMRLTWGALPIDNLPISFGGGKPSGVVAAGEFLLVNEGEQLTLRAAVPLNLRQLAWAQSGRRLIDGLQLTAQPSVEFTGAQNFKLQTGEVLIQNSAGENIFSGQGQLSQSTDTDLRGSLTLAVELPALLAQPFWGAAPLLTAGRISGEIRVAGNELKHVEARLTSNGLVAATGSDALPVANLSFRMIVQPNGQVSVQAPLLLDRAGRRSDLNLNLELQPRVGGYTVAGRVSGTQVDYADAIALAGLVSAAALPRSAAVSVPVGGVENIADATPAWAQYNGQVTLDVKTVTWGADWAMTGLTGQLGLEPTRLVLEQLSATMGEKSKFAARGEIKFSAGIIPYNLRADFSLPDFDAGKFFQVLTPTKPPTIEGLFTIQGDFVGAGLTLPQLMARTRGSFELASPQGIFRGLQRSTNKLSLSSKAVELGASVLGSLFGTQKVTHAAEKVVGTAYFIDQLAQTLGELKFEQLKVHVVRTDKLDLELKDFRLRTPDISLTGQGAVTYQAGLAWLEQPLNLKLTMAGRGKTEQILGKLKLLDGQRDALGYATLRDSLTVTGSLAKPDASAFFIGLAANKLTDFFTPEP